MLTVNDVEGIRRSAAMAPLSSAEAFRVLEACDQLLRERARIVAVLADLPASWGTGAQGAQRTSGDRRVRDMN